MSTHLFILQSRSDKIDHYDYSWSDFTKTTTHPKDIIPRRGLITSTKIQIFLHKCKKMAKKFFAIFSLEAR